MKSIKQSGSLLGIPNRYQHPIHSILIQIHYLATTQKMRCIFPETKKYFSGTVAVIPIECRFFFTKQQDFLPIILPYVSYTQALAFPKNQKLASRAFVGHSVLPHACFPTALPENCLLGTSPIPGNCPLRGQAAHPFRTLTYLHEYKK
jgi:hypothetical protein